MDQRDQEDNDRILEEDVEAEEEVCHIYCNCISSDPLCVQERLEVTSKTSQKQKKPVQDDDSNDSEKSMDLSVPSSSRPVDDDDELDEDGHSEVGGEGGDGNTVGDDDDEAPADIAEGEPTSPSRAKKLVEYKNAKEAANSMLMLLSVSNLKVKFDLV